MGTAGYLKFDIRLDTRSIFMLIQVKTEKGQETPARTGLGSTTVLAVVTVGFGFVVYTSFSLSLPCNNTNVYLSKKVSKMFFQAKMYLHSVR